MRTNRCSDQPCPCASGSAEHLPWVALWLFGYIQYILWQDCSDTESNCRESCGGVDSAEMNCIRGSLALHSVITSPPFFDNSLVIECTITAACNGQPPHPPELVTAVRSEYAQGCFFCLCHITAWSSFPAAINVTYFLNPLILVWWVGMIWTGNIIRLGWSLGKDSFACWKKTIIYIYMYVFTVCQCHKQALEALVISVERDVSRFCCRRSVWEFCLKQRFLLLCVLFYKTFLCHWLWFVIRSFE